MYAYSRTFPFQLFETHEYVQYYETFQKINKSTNY